MKPLFGPAVVVTALPKAQSSQRQQLGRMAVSFFFGGPPCLSFFRGCHE